jgi:hypothetical protein
MSIRVRRADYKRAVGELPPDYPDAEEGGSRNFPPIPTATAEEEEGGKDAKKDAKKDGKKGDGDDDEEVEEQAPPDKFVIDLHGASQEFLHVWLPRDEKNNFMQEHDEELLKDELRDGVREKIRLEVRLGAFESPVASSLHWTNVNRSLTQLTMLWSVAGG